MTTGEPRVVSEGPRCRNCRRTEARCAWLGKCCAGCLHFRKLDENGNDRTKPVVVDVRPVCMTCRRPIPATGRAECVGDCREVRRAHDRRRAAMRYGRSA